MGAGEGAGATGRAGEFRGGDALLPGTLVSLLVKVFERAWRACGGGNWGSSWRWGQWGRRQRDPTTQGSAAPGFRLGPVGLLRGTGVELGWNWCCRFPAGWAGRAAFLRAERGEPRAAGLSGALICPCSAPNSVQLRDLARGNAAAPPRAGSLLSGAGAGSGPQVPGGGHLPQSCACPIPTRKPNPLPLLGLGQKLCKAQ